MDNLPYHCPKCSGQMEQGFVVDTSWGLRGVSHWAVGAPLKSFRPVRKLPDEKLIPIGTFRCSSCGYLESYARQQFAAQT